MMKSQNLNDVRLLIDISFALMKARRRQTLVAAVGVTFGITMFITLLSFMTGLNEMLDNLILNRTPHIRLYKEITINRNQPIQLSPNSDSTYHFIESLKSNNSRVKILNAQKIISAIEQDKRVLGYSRKLATQCFFNLGTVNITGFMNGIDVEKEIKFYKFADYITVGKPADLGNVPNSIILGKPLAEMLLAEIGDVVQITTIRGDIFSLKVVGFYQSGLSDFDKTQSFASIATVQKVLGKSNNYITDIQIKLKDSRQAIAMAKEYESKFETNAIDIQKANAQFETGTKVRNIISYAVGITLLVVAGFGIYNILNMMIYEKMDTIAILKATGFSGKDVQLVFMLISLTIGFLGCIAGLISGNILSRIISYIPFNTPALPTVKTFPVAYQPIFYLIAIVFSLITTFFAGWFPARKAGAIDPVDIIRGK